MSSQCFESASGRVVLKWDGGDYFTEEGAGKWCVSPNCICSVGFLREYSVQDPTGIRVAE